MRPIEGIWAAPINSPTPTPSITPTLSFTPTISSTPGSSVTPTPTPTPTPSLSHIGAWNQVTVTNVPLRGFNGKGFGGSCVVGDSNAIFVKETNDITDWTSIDDGHTGSAFDYYNIMTIGPSLAVNAAVGTNTNLYQSTNLTGPWSKKTLAGASSNFRSIRNTEGGPQFGGENNPLAQYCIVGTNATILGSNNVGTSWSAQFTTGLTGLTINDICGDSIVCEDGSIWHHFGGNPTGQAWINDVAATATALNCIIYDPYRNVFEGTEGQLIAIGDNGTFLIGSFPSIAGSVTWHTVNCGSSVNLNEMYVSEREVMIVGDNGTILLTLDTQNFISEISSTSADLTNIGLAYNGGTDSTNLCYLITADTGIILWKNYYGL